MQWDFAQTLPALGIRGVTAHPLLLAQGSHADIYANPVDPATVIKVTGDAADANNTVVAQTLNSPNVVRCHGQTTQGVIGGTALLVDFVKGTRAPYSTPEFLGLIEGRHGTDPRDQAHIRILRPEPFRAHILQAHGRLDRGELVKLSSLFNTIFVLESRLNIFLVDLAENIIDTGTAYVIVDFGR